jgi:DNA-binding response OmpR family regulator
MTHADLDPSPVATTQRCILIAEDEMLVALMLQDMLTDLGFSTVMAARVGKAAKMAATAAVDCAILDLDLGGEPSYPVAEELRRRGVPIVFSTGYGRASLSADYWDCPILSKPYSEEELERVLTQALAAGAP